jgi:hypothetical protein
MMTAEELCIKNIENGIRAIRLNLKHPRDTMAPYALNKLKAINIGLYYDYMEKYKRVMKEFEKNNK